MTGDELTEALAKGYLKQDRIDYMTWANAREWDREEYRSRVRILVPVVASLIADARRQALLDAAAELGPWDAGLGTPEYRLGYREALQDVTYQLRNRASRETT